MPGSLKRTGSTNRTSLRYTLMCAGLVSMAVLSVDLAGCASPSTANASKATAATNPLPPPAVTLHPNPAFASLPRYEGTLGKRAIVLHLGEKTDPEDAGGLHGEYQFQDTGQVVLVAGDGGDGVVELDESDDGTRISGQWVGKLNADGTFKGVWSNVDESETESIELHRVAAGASAK
jgi:hypothetical protein